MSSSIGGEEEFRYHRSNSLVLAQNQQEEVSGVHDVAAEVAAAPAKWSHSSLIQLVLRSNMMQRLVSSALLAPAVLYFIYYSPVPATVSVCSILVSIGNYEYAWLSYRIHFRLISSWHPDFDVFSDIESNHQEQGEETMVCDPLDESVAAVKGFADRFTNKSIRLAAFLVAVILAGLLTTIVYLIHGFTDQMKDRQESFQLISIYVPVCSFFCIFSAALHPTRTSAIVSVIEQFGFSLMTFNSILCHDDIERCVEVLDPSYVMESMAILIIIIRVITSHHVKFYHRSTHGYPSLKAMISAIYLALDLVGLIYVTGLVSIVADFVDFEGPNKGRCVLVTFLCVVWGADSGAYFTGKLLAYLNYKSKYILAPHLSPNKDIEGTFGGILCGIACMAVASDIVKLEGTWLKKILYTVVGVCVGRIGDVFESMLKRCAGVKDSGVILPGHGGLLDRIDALLFVAIVFQTYNIDFEESFSRSQPAVNHHRNGWFWK